MKFHILSTLAILLCTSSISAQELLNHTKFPSNALGPSNLYEIKQMNGKVTVPLYRANSDIWWYLPNMEIDSFYTPINPFTGDLTEVSMYAEYEPNVGLVDNFVVNVYRKTTDVSIQNEYVCFSVGANAVVFDNHILKDIPAHPDDWYGLQHIVVYNTETNTYDYVHEFAEDRQVDVITAIDGDYVYVNVPLIWDDRDDLLFMGDTLTFDDSMFYGGDNYLSKINFKTGEKVWTRHIGYGEVQDIFIDNRHRLNIDMVSGNAAMIDLELYEDAFQNGGLYDRLLYQITPDGELLTYTDIRTKGDLSIIKVEFNDDGSFQAFGLVQSPVVVDVIGASLDFTDGVSFLQSQGLVLVYDEDYNYQWSKRIDSDGRTSVWSVHKTPSGDFLVSFSCNSESFTMDGVTHEGEPLEGESEGLTQSMILKLDGDGNLRGQPYINRMFALVEDMEVLGDDQYLFLFRPLGTLGFPFLGVTITANSRIHLVEFKGDLFNDITSTDAHFDRESCSVNPNVVSQGGFVKIDVPQSMTFPLTIQLVTSEGEVVETRQIQSDMYSLPSRLLAGMYYLKIMNYQHIEAIPLIIK